MTSPDAEAQHEQALAALLGGPAHLTREQVARAAGMDQATADGLWQSLGFPRPGDEASFTDADVDALRAVGTLIRVGILPGGKQVELARELGRAMAGLAEGQVETATDAEAAGFLDSPLELVDTMGRLQDLVWRRHLLAATERRAARPAAGSVEIVVGFTDLVSFTARSRELSTHELATLLDGFEARATAVVVDGGGRVVKTLGDEVMWTASTPVAGARIALALATDDVRTGAAFGPTLARGGDQFGPTVNLASRLTGLARPGTVLVDRELSGRLADDEAFRLRHLRAISVRGYDHLRASVLRTAT